VRLQELAKSAAGARDARHDGADGDVEDNGDVFVLDLFYIAEEEGFAELRLKLFERGAEGGLVVEADEGVFRGWTGGGGVECVGMPARVVRKVLRRMRKIQALKFVSCWKESKARRALVKVSCTRSSASA
jgi:hypothetical protein